MHSQPADGGGDVLAHLAENLRKMRQAKGWSQERLASQAGLSRRMVAAIEGTGANISLSNVDRLAAALSVKFSDLVRPTDAIDARRIESLAWRGTQAGSHAVLLGAAPSTRESELWAWKLAPGEVYGSEENSGEWHEMLFVIEGTLTLRVLGETRSVGVGEFLIFSSADPYVFTNEGSTMLHYLRVVVL